MSKKTKTMNFNKIENYGTDNTNIIDAFIPVETNIDVVIHKPKSNKVLGKVLYVKNNKTTISFMKDNIEYALKAKGIYNSKQVEIEYHGNIPCQQNIISISEDT